MPAGDNEWWKSPDGIWIPIPRGGVGGASSERIAPPFLAIPFVLSTPALTGLALNAGSGYTFGSAGNGIGFRTQPGADFTLTNVYYYISASAGTQANINVVNFELRNDNGSQTGPDTSGGATLHTSGSADPNGDSGGAFVGWHKITPTQFTMTAGTMYWAIVTRTGQNGTDFPTIGHSFSNCTPSLAGTLNYASQRMPWTTTNGFSTTTVSAAGGCIAVLVLEDNNSNVMGSSLTTTGTSTSSTNRRGIFLQFANSMTVYGMLTHTASANISGMEVYDTSAATPGSGQLATSSTILYSTTGARLGARLLNEYTLAKATSYRLVFTYSAAATTPSKHSIGQQNTYTTPTQSAKSGGTNWYWTEANGTTNWNNDDQTALPHIGLFLDDQVSSGGGLMVNPGMYGGMRG